MLFLWWFLFVSGSAATLSGAFAFLNNNFLTSGLFATVISFMSHNNSQLFREF